MMRVLPILTLTLALSTPSAEPGSSATELKAQILQHLAPETEAHAGFCFRFSYSFEGCLLIARQTHCTPPPAGNENDWTETVSRARLQEMNPARVYLNTNGVALFAAADRKVIETREKWQGTVVAGRPIERRSLGELHAYVARTKAEREILAEDFRHLIRLCGGSSIPPRRDPPPLIESIAGIRIGPQPSTSQQVTNILGAGREVNAVGRKAERYFTDPAGRVTLRVTSGSDHSVASLELTAGLSLPAGMKPSASTSPLLASRPPIDQNLALGMSFVQVVEKLGQPQTDVRKADARILLYEALAQDNPRVRMYHRATLKLVEDRLVSLAITAN